MLYSYHWMTGVALGFQLNETFIINEDDEAEEKKCLLLYLGILELAIYWS